METLDLIDMLLGKSPEEIERIFSLLHRMKSEKKKEPAVYLYIDSIEARHFWVVNEEEVKLGSYHSVVTDRIGTKYYFAPDGKGFSITKNLYVYSGALQTSPIDLKNALSRFTKDICKELEG